jgi:hypothetical protein
MLTWTLKSTTGRPSASLPHPKAPRGLKESALARAGPRHLVLVAMTAEAAGKPIAVSSAASQEGA